MPISDERKQFLKKQKENLGLVRQSLGIVRQIEVAVSKMPPSVTRNTMKYEFSKARKMLQKLERKHQLTSSEEIAKFADDKVLKILLRSQAKLGLNITHLLQDLLKETVAYFERVEVLAKKAKVEQDKTGG